LASSIVLPQSSPATICFYLVNHATGLDRTNHYHLNGRMTAERNIILTGYRATGKSAVGRLLAQRLGRTFLDTDRLIEERQGCTIKELVAAHGWPYFREVENKLLDELAGGTGLVIATGGGAILHRQAWAALRASGLVVWLTADRETICRRLEADGVTEVQRPSLTGQGIDKEVAGVLAEREPLYREGSDLAIDTACRSPEEVAREIEGALGGP
jgi:shikimate kinase